MPEEMLQMATIVLEVSDCMVWPMSTLLANKSG